MDNLSQILEHLVPKTVLPSPRKGDYFNLPGAFFGKGKGQITLTFQKTWRLGLLLLTNPAHCGKMTDMGKADYGWELL